MISALLRASARIIFVLFISSVAFAQSQQLKRQGSSGIPGLVVTDGAQVYSKPSFDAPIISELKGGSRVQVSNGTVLTDPKFKDSPKFYKVRVGNKIGFISDGDIRVPRKFAPGGAKKTAGKKKSTPSRDDSKKPTLVADRNPMFFTRYVGGLAGFVMYKEKISGVKAEETILVYGLKVTGPDVIFTGPIIDFNLALHYGAPSYYNKLASLKPRGFLLFTDLLLMMPLRIRDNYSLYAEAGPSLAYSTFSVVNDEKALSLTQLNIGATLGFGAAMRFNKTAVRLEARYTAEKTTFPSALLSVQGQF